MALDTPRSPRQAPSPFQTQILIHLCFFFYFKSQIKLIYKSRNYKVFLDYRFLNAVSYHNIQIRVHILSVCLFISQSILTWCRYRFPLLLRSGDSQPACLLLSLVKTRQLFGCLKDKKIFSWHIIIIFSYIIWSQ